MIYLHFDTSDAGALQSAAAQARGNGIPAEDAVLFDRAAETAAKDQVLTIDGGSQQDADRIADLFASFGVTRPTVEFR